MESVNIRLRAIIQLSPTTGGMGWVVHERTSINGTRCLKRRRPGEIWDGAETTKPIDCPACIRVKENDDREVNP